MIESDLSRIATALELIAAALSAKPVKAAKDTPAPVAVQAPVVAPVAAPVVAAPAMPAAPFPMPVASPVAVVPVVAAPVAPVATAFSSKEEMTQFVINSYRALGAEKGAMIQGVLTAMGYANINDVDPARWGELKAGIEALAK